jgi:thymidylate kinase
MRLIAFEGSDYSGKTSTAKRVVEILGEKNKRVIYNTGSIYGLDSPEFYGEANPFISELQRESLYISSFLMDKKFARGNDDRVIFQDRYWMSVVAYGRFLNNSSSLHRCVDVSKYMWMPDLVVYLSCSLGAKIERSNLRGIRSVIDKYVLNGCKELDDLECEIDKVVSLCPDVVRIDTTDKSVDEVACLVGLEVRLRGYL